MSKQYQVELTVAHGIPGVTETEIKAAIMLDLHHRGLETESIMIEEIKQ